MSSQNGDNPGHTQQEMNTADNMLSAGESILRNMLTETKLFCAPGTFSGGWCLVELDVDGKKVPNAVLLLAQNNTASAVWMDVESMEQFANNTMMTLNMLRNAVMQSMPLIVANPEQMQQALQAKKDIEGKFGSMQNINWPPEEWKH